MKCCGIAWCSRVSKSGEAQGGRGLVGGAGMSQAERLPKKGACVPKAATVPSSRRRRLLACLRSHAAAGIHKNARLKLQL